MRNLNYGTNDSTYETKADMQTQRTGLRLPRGGAGEGWVRSFGVSRCPLFYAERADSKDLLWSSWNYTPHPEIHHQSNECGKECTCVCTPAAHCCRAEISTAL